MTLSTSRTSTSNSLYQSVYDIWTAQLHRFQRYDLRPKFKKGHMTPNTPIEGQFVIPSLTLGIFFLYAKFGDSRFSCSGDCDCKRQNWKWVLWPWTRPFYGWSATRKLAFHIVYFDDSSFSRSKDMAKIWLVPTKIPMVLLTWLQLFDLTTPPSGIVCDSWARTCYLSTKLEVYSLWTVLNRPLQRYERRY